MQCAYRRSFHIFCCATTSLGFLLPFLLPFTPPCNRSGLEAYVRVSKICGCERERMSLRSCACSAANASPTTHSVATRPTTPGVLPRCACSAVPGRRRQTSLVLIIVPFREGRRHDNDVSSHTNYFRIFLPFHLATPARAEGCVETNPTRGRASPQAHLCPRTPGGAARLCMCVRAAMLRPSLHVHHRSQRSDLRG